MSDIPTKRRAPFIGGNWKSKGIRKEITQLCAGLNDGAAPVQYLDVVVAPSFLHLGYVAEKLKRSFEISAQDCSQFNLGAFTGDLSATAIRDFGINWVILGHSERRNYHKESDEVVAGKIKLALKAGLRVIACFGEKLEERKAGTTEQVVLRQVKAICDAVQATGSFWNLVLAYEPVWAIGTGLAATKEQAQEVHALVRKYIAANYGARTAAKQRIIYGGSVKPKNATALYKQPDIDGFLVGGASLKAEQFLSIMSQVEDQFIAADAIKAKL